MAYVLIGLGALSIAYGILMAVLYPAGGFFLVWIALGAALVAAGRIQKIRRVVCGVCAAGLIAAGVICGMICGTAAATPPAGLDYLVVLGAGLRPDGTPSESLCYRLDAAHDYLEANPDTLCVVSGGQGFGEVRTEADAMLDYLVDAGVPEDRIIQERESSTTAENIRFTRELLPAEATVGVVTNDFHLYRALRIAQKNGLPEAQGLAAPSNPLYLPHAMLRECAAIMKDAAVGNI